MAYHIENAVQTTLSAAVAAGDAVITVHAGIPPFITPPDPGGRPAPLEIVDGLDITKITSREVLTYTGRTDNGDGTYTLTGVTRGTEGTAAQAWNVADFAIQTATTRSLFHARTVVAQETDVVEDLYFGTIKIEHLPDGQTVSIRKAVLLRGDGRPAPTGLDLEIHTLDNAGGQAHQATIVAGDGTTIHDGAIGNPLASYTNTSGAGQTIAILAKNDTRDRQRIHAYIQGAIEG